MFPQPPSRIRLADLHLPRAQRPVGTDQHGRAGRSAVERAALIRALLPKISEILGVPRYAIWIYLSELPARAMAEFGHMLPEPGDDDAWLAALPEEDRKRLEQLG